MATRFGTRATAPNSRSTWTLERLRVRCLLIHALTGQVGPRTNLSSYPTNQELDDFKDTHRRLTTVKLRRYSVCGTELRDGISVSARVLGSARNTLSSTPNWRGNSWISRAVTHCD